MELPIAWPSEPPDPNGQFLLRDGRVGTLREALTEAIAVNETKRDQLIERIARQKALLEACPHV